MDPNLFRALRNGDRAAIHSLISDNPRCLHDSTAQSNTTLHITAGLGYAWCVSEIVDREPEFLFAANSRGDTALHCAARAGHQLALALLVSSAKSRVYLNQQGAVMPGADVLEMRNACGNTPLHEAARNGRAGAAQELLNAAPRLAGLVNYRGESPLYLAAERGAVEIVRLLMVHPDCDVRGPNGQTALHAAVCRSYEITELLLETIPDLNRQADASHSTPLHYAASIGDQTMVQLLLENDASIAHLLDKDDLSACHVAAGLGYVDVISEILQHCPDAFELTDKTGGNFLHLAAKKKRAKVVKYVLQTQVLQDLINESDADGNTPLHIATINHNQEIVHLLLADGRADTIARNHEGLTPLDLASFLVDSGIRLRTHKIITELVSAGSKFSPQRMDLMNNKLHRKREEEISRCRAIANNLAIVAVLIATVTFAAAFTLPGGYRNDDSPNQGLAILAKKAAFKAFLIADAIAMVSSITVTCLLIYTGSHDHDVRLHSINTAMKIMWVALGGMVVAFAMGIYVVVVSDCSWLAILICAMACSVPFIAWMVTCWPALDSLKLENRARNREKKVRKSVTSKIVNLPMPPSMLRLQMPHAMVVDFETPICSKGETV